MTKTEKNLRVVSFSPTDGFGSEVPAVALITAPGEALWPWSLKLACELERHYRPSYALAGESDWHSEGYRP